MHSALRLAVIVGIASLAACDGHKTADESLRDCVFEAHKAFSQVNFDDWRIHSDQQIKSFLASCMGTKGFSHDGGAEDCSLSDVEWQTACYKRAD